VPLRMQEQVIVIGRVAEYCYSYDPQRTLERQAHTAGIRARAGMQSAPALEQAARAPEPRLVLRPKPVVCSAREPSDADSGGRLTP
jgi:hypothetical protein